MSAENLKNTWQAIFRRKGADGVYTRLVDSMDAGQRSTLLTAIQLRAKELPVIGSLRGPNSWLVLTTERLVWAVAGERHEIAVGAIRDATADFKQLENRQSKLEMRTLRVTTLAGDEYSIELEPGQPLSGTWSVLKHLGTRNRHAIEPSL